MTGICPAERGFTLVELLVSLAITGSAAALLSAALWSGRRMDERGAGRVAAVAGVAAAQDLLRDRIEHLMVERDPSTPQAPPDVRGERASFGFTALPVAARAPAPPLRYLLGLSPGGRLQLLSIDARATAAVAGPANWRALPLLDGVRAVELAYYGAGADGRAPHWQSTWIDQEDPPALVRVRVRFDRGDLRRWPDLVIAPAVNIRASCRIDPATGGCRAEA